MIRLVALYELNRESLRALPRTTFADRKVLERDDLQRLLRDQISILAEDVLVIAEEFGAFQDSRRRIDLLGVDRAGRIVVIELKRTEDGGHLELQALRYAAMVSAMTFENAVAAYESHLLRLGRDPSTARTVITDWITDGDTEGTLSADVRIVLVSANFDPEITTTVLWLNSYDRMDIRCVRLVPYLLDERLVIDVQQVLPLPEAADYQVRIRDKEVETRTLARASDGRDWTAYVVITPSGESEPLRKRRAVLHMVRELHAAGIAPARIATVLPISRFAPVPDTALSGRDLRDAFQRQYRGVVPGGWFLDEDEVIPDDAGTVWVLTKRWSRYTVEQALADLAALAEPGAFTFRSESSEPGSLR